MSEWHLVCVTRLGRVSILKNLDKPTAIETYRKLKSDERPVRHVSMETGQPVSGMFLGGNRRAFGKDDDWLETIHAIGPEGEEFKPWEGAEPLVRQVSSEWLKQMGGQP